MVAFFAWTFSLGIGGIIATSECFPSRKVIRLAFPLSAISTTQDNIPKHRRHTSSYGFGSLPRVRQLFGDQLNILRRHSFLQEAFCGCPRRLQCYSATALTPKCAVSRSLPQTNRTQMGENARQVKTWIAALGLVENHDQDGGDLRALLRDGVLLCRLVNRLKPGTISKVTEGPKFCVNCELITQFCHVNYA